MFHFTFIFLEQADDVVFRVTLEKNQAKAVGAYRQMHAGILTLHKHRQASGTELVAADFIEA